MTKNNWDLAKLIDYQDNEVYINKNHVTKIHQISHDIIEIELISLDYEYNRRLFDNTNNEIYITHEQDNITYSISIPQGYYNTTQQVINNFNNVYSRNMETLTHSISLKYSELHKAFYFINLLKKDGLKETVNWFYGNLKNK